jgi:hypothetical protein
MVLPAPPLAACGRSLLAAHGPQLGRSLQDCSPAFIGSCLLGSSSNPAAKNFPRKTSPLPGLDERHRCAWLRQLSAGSGFAFREEESPSSANRDADQELWDSFRAAGVKANRSPTRRSSYTSQVATGSFALGLMSGFGPQEPVLATLPGTAKSDGDERRRNLPGSDITIVC